ncbi:MAG TPA: ABC transporter permease [Actinomycetota bacterium]
MRAVPIGRRNLFSDRRRAILGVAGVAVALLLTLALDGIFAGAMRQVTRYIDESGADLFVSQRGVRTMHMSSSAIPLTSVEEIRGMPGVRWADPILYDTGAVLASGKRQLTYLIGYVPGRRGGASRLAAGTEPGDGEIVLDEDAAATLGVGVGGRVEILERTWRVSGLATQMTNIVNSVSYVPFQDFADARGVTDVASYVLVGAQGSIESVRAAVEAVTGLTAQTRVAFASQERQGIKDMSTDLLQIMTFAAFLIGIAVIGLTLYAATLSRLHEIGVMKALGGTSMLLSRSVLSQAAWTVGLALAAGWLAALGFGWLLGRTGGSFPIVIEAGSVVRAGIGAMLLAALGAVVPLIKVSRVDPATVFRRKS